MFRETFLLTPRVLQHCAAEAGGQYHVTHLLRQVPIICDHTATAGVLSMKTKAELRAAAMAARSSLSARARGDASARAAMRIAETKTFLRAKTVALYSAIKSEADPHDLTVIAARVGKRIAYPRVGENGIDFVAVDPQQLRLTGPFAIPEPPRELGALEVGAIDLFIVPGLCFSRAGDRIGYGKGYYDRALAAARIKNPRMVTIGFAFEVQIFDALPVEPYDVRLNGVCTENALTLTDRNLL